MATTVQQPDNAANPLNQFLARSQTINWQLILYIVIFLLAVFTRFYALGDRAMSHDESLHTRYSYNLYADGNFQHTPLMHGPILFHATAFFYFLFGDNDFSARLYPAILGVIVVMFPILFRRWLGNTGALVASFLLLISPITLYYHRYIRHDTPSIFFALLMIYAIMMYVSGPVNQRRKGYWLYLLAGAMIGNLGSKETAFIYIGIIGSFLTLYWLVRLLQHLRGVPGRTLFYFLSLSILLAGVAALGMYIVLSIIPPATAIQAAELNGSWLNNVDTLTFILGTLLVIVATLVVLFGTLFWAFRNSRVAFKMTDWAFILLLGTVVCLGLIIIEEVSHVSASNATETAVPALPGEEGEVQDDGLNSLPLILAWVGAAVVIAGLFVSWRLGWWETLKQFPEFDTLIVMGTLILPWITPFILVFMGASPTDYSPDGRVRAVLALIPLASISIAVGLIWNWRRWLICAALFLSIFAFFFTTMFTNINGLATGMIGSLGYWLEQQGVRRGSQPQYYYLGLILPFYEFLPVIGSILAMFSGMTWFWGFRRQQLENQADVEALDATVSAEIGQTDERQAIEASVVAPDLEMDLEAETPPLDDLIGDVSATGDNDPRKTQVKAGTHRLDQIPFLLFVSWWAILNLIGYTLAGEKMPWLAIHMTLPLIFLTGWYFGRLFDRVDRDRFQRGGWIYLLLVPLLIITGFQVIGPLFIGQGPFGGLQQFQLAQSGQWLAVVAIMGFVILAIYQVIQHTGWRHFRHMFAVGIFAVLSLITTRSAFMASFINYDYSTEYLVYAHAAPAIKTVLNQLEDISLRTTDGKALTFAYDNETSWPYSWYFRDFPNARFFGSSPSRPIIDESVAVVVGEANRAAVEPLLEDRYYHFEYIRLWWPMQDYFNLTPERISNTFDFSPENTQAAQLRQGLFDIWWARDYTAYGQALSRSFDVTQWPVSDRMHFYVRKDVAAQIWNLGIGEGEVYDPTQDIAENVCNSNWQRLQASTVFGNTGAVEAQLNRPIGMSVAADGTLYIAEETNNRVSVFSADGVFLNAFAAGTGVSFTRPSGVAVGPDGNIYVADTWNYQVKVLSPTGELLRSWGEPGEFGLGAQPDPVYGFWGPRDVVVDAAGQVYVADTGNKRIRVYTANGDYVRDLGSGGSAEGQLDEPSGLALHPDGRLFVADYWNRRITVFDTNTAEFRYTFPVRAWYDEQGNRPYLAVDPVRDLVYVTDPDAGRVLVYNTAGDCQGSFGQANRETVDASQFRLTAGLAVAGNGNVYVSDAGTGRVLLFAPFMPGLPEPVSDEAAANPANRLSLEEITEETRPEETEVIEPAG